MRKVKLQMQTSAIGEGMPIFKGRTPMRLVASKAFECAIFVLQYSTAKLGNA